MRAWVKLVARALPAGTIERVVLELSGGLTQNDVAEPGRLLIER